MVQTVSRPLEISTFISKDQPVPGSRIPSGACQSKFKVARSLRKCVVCDKFEIVGLMAFTSELRQPIWRLLFPIFDVLHILEKKLRRGKMWVLLTLKPVRLLGACKPGSRARMDSRTGNDVEVMVIVGI